MMLMSLGMSFEVDGKSADATESSPAQCELCKILKTVRMIEQCANNQGNRRLLLEMLSFR